MAGFPPDESDAAPVLRNQPKAQHKARGMGTFLDSKYLDTETHTSSAEESLALLEATVARGKERKVARVVGAACLQNTNSFSLRRQRPKAPWTVMSTEFSDPQISRSLTASSLPACAQAQPQHLGKAQKDAVELRQRLQEDGHVRLDFHGFGGNVDGLRAYLAHKYGDSIRGWREEFAPDKVGVGPVSFNQFVRGLKRTGFAGNAQSLWRAISKNKSVVTMEDLEPDVSRQLDLLSKCLLQKFPGGAVQAWSVMKREHRVRATFDEIARFFDEKNLGELCSAEGISFDARRIFEVMDSMTPRGTLICEEFQFLDHWMRRHMMKGRALALSEMPTGLEPANHYSQLFYSGFSQPTASSKEKVAGSSSSKDPLKTPPPELEPYVPPSPRSDPTPGVDEFRKHLAQSFGSPARAWRVAFDVKGHGNGTVSCGDFGKVCRAVGWRHPHVPIWRDLREAGGGQVTLRAVDPDSANAIDTFNEAVIAQFGGLKRFWELHLDDGGTGAVSRSEFLKDATRHLGIDLNAARAVFQVLDVAAAGWVADTEIGFIEMFEDRRNSQGFNPSMSTSSFRSSLSAPALTMSKSDSGWNSSPWLWATERPGSLVSPSSEMQTSSRPEIWSPARSTTKTQQRILANAHGLKHRWMSEAVLQRCAHASKENVMRSSKGMRGALRSSAQNDRFRYTNEFYRSGMKKLMAKEMEEDYDANYTEDQD